MEQLIAFLKLAGSLTKLVEGIVRIMTMASEFRKHNEKGR